MPRRHTATDPDWENPIGGRHSVPHGWTLDTLLEHLSVVARMNKEFDEERDRRYAEVNVEREKALKIKETADLAALQLAREIQTYKDEKANQLREQISSERGSFATKDDLAAMKRELDASISPLGVFAANESGQSKGISSFALFLFQIISGVAALAGVVSVVILISSR